MKIFQPWYERLQCAIQIKNSCAMPLLVTITSGDAYGLQNLKKIKISPAKPFQLFAGASQNVKVSTIMGLQRRLDQTVNIETAYKPPITLKLHAMPRIPMVTILNLKRPGIYDINPELEYEALRKIFEDEIKNIVVFQRYSSENELKYWCNDSNASEGPGLLKSRESSSIKSLKKTKKGSTSLSRQSSKISHSSNKMPSISNMKRLYVDCSGVAKEELEVSQSVLSLTDSDFWDFEILDYPVCCFLYTIA
jgi:hypothetical protein